MAEGFTGNIQINFFRGSIRNVNISESLQPPKGEARIPSVKNNGNPDGGIRTSGVCHVLKKEELPAFIP